MDWTAIVLTDWTAILVALFGMVAAVLGAGGGIAWFRDRLKAGRDREQEWREEAHYYRDQFERIMPLLEKQTEILEWMAKEWGYKK